MSLIFKKVFKTGPFRTTLSKRGTGTSWGISWFRIGISPSGKKYFILCVPGTGLYFLKYIKTGNIPAQGKKTEVTRTNETDQ
jgi:hypothetical protein